MTGLETQREFAQRKHALSARSDDAERPPRGQRVRSLPAFLPGTEIDAPSGHAEAFQSLSEQLLNWLVNGRGADQALKMYASGECAKLRAAATGHGNVR